MRVGVLRIELHLPFARSLKEKRRPLKSLIQRLANRFPVSVSEVDYQDLHQRAALGVAVVAPDGAHLADILRAVRTFVENNPDMPVLSICEATHGDPEEKG